MNLSAVYHEAKSRFAYAYDRETLHIRLRTARGDIPAVTLVGGDPFRWIQSEEDPTHWEWDKSSASFEPMKLEYRTRLYDYWFAAVRPPWLRFRYAFLLQDGDQKILYGSRAFYDLNRQPEFELDTFTYFNFPYLNPEDVFSAPAWVKDTVWYQIFPDRYADGDPRSNPPGALPWDSAEHGDVRRLMGGDLQGVIDHLDDLQELGISGLYFTPIFASPSSHKYDTSDYYQIDPSFGTNELFGQMVREAHRRGMRVMLDAVFNHCGWFHPFWQDVVQNGRKSAYYDCFYITGDPPINFELKDGKPGKLTSAQAGRLNYRAFGFTPNMPKWNTDHPLVKEHLLGAIRYWTERYQVDGWRLDVSNEVSHSFWREFRRLVKGINPQVYIMGENWDNAGPWLGGDQFDGVMNYELLTDIWGLVGKKDRVREPLDVCQFQDAISQLLTSYPKNVLPAMYNLIDCHDTARIDYVCGEQVERVKLAYGLQFTFPGAPSVYYGSEVGLGGGPHHNRAPMPWDKARWDLDLRRFVQRLITLRCRYPAFRAVDLTWLSADPATGSLVFKKTAGEETLYVLINTGEQAQTIELPEELKDGKVRDLLVEAEVQVNGEITLAGLGMRLLLK